MKLHFVPRIQLISSIGLSMLLLACGADPAGPNRDSSGGFSPEQDSGTCTGPVVECYKFEHRRSCGYHIGCRWDTYVDDCNGNQLDCDETRSKDDCLHQVNCVWTNPDGTQEAQPRHVNCTGAAVSCDNYGDRDTCNPQYGCSWDAVDERCTGNDKPRICGVYTVDGYSSYHPKVAVSICRQIPGCTTELLDINGDPVPVD